MSPSVSGVERFIFGVDDSAEIDAWLSTQVAARLGVPLQNIVFRAGRVDAVYGLRLADGRQVVLKVHRPPVHVAHLLTQSRLQGVLVDAGYPAARPVLAPQTWASHTVSVEFLLNRGIRADPHAPDVRRIMAGGLVDLVDILRSRTSASALGRPPAWTDYRSGRWRVSHDRMFDFTRPVPAEWEFVEQLAATAAAVLASRTADEQLVIGHSDWHCGNMRFTVRGSIPSSLAAVFDLDLFVDTEPVVAGFAAANHLGGSFDGDTPTPDQVVAFLTDYETARGTPFSKAQQHHAAAAATCALTYNGRCGLSVMDPDRPQQPPPTWSPLAGLRTFREEYLTIQW